MIDGRQCLGRKVQTFSASSEQFAWTAKPKPLRWSFRSFRCLRVFQTAALEVFSAVRNSSWGGIITVVGAVMVLVGIGVAVTHTGKGRTAEGIVTEKIVVRYVETGEVRDGLRFRKNLSVGCVRRSNISRPGVTVTKHMLRHMDIFWKNRFPRAREYHWQVFT